MCSARYAGAAELSMPASLFASRPTIRFHRSDSIDGVVESVAFGGSDYAIEMNLPHWHRE